MAGCPEGRAQKACVPLQKLHWQQKDKFHQYYQLRTHLEKLSLIANQCDVSFSISVQSGIHHSVQSYSTWNTAVFFSYNSQLLIFVFMVSTVINCWSEEKQNEEKFLWISVFWNRWKKPQLSSEQSFPACGLWVVNCGNVGETTCSLEWMAVNVAWETQSTSGLWQTHKQMDPQSNGCLSVFQYIFKNRIFPSSASWCLVQYIFPCCHFLSINS